LVVVVFLIVGGTTQSRLSQAVQLCESLQPDMTGENDVADWIPWAEALSNVFLHHQLPEMPQNQQDDAMDCALKGWKAGCTKKVFSSTAADQHQVEIIERDRRALEEAYRKSVDKVRPMEQELRLPAGVALSYKEQVADAQRGVCEIPPKDRTCIAARSEEVKAIRVIRTELKAAVRPKAGGEGLSPSGSDMTTVKRLATLVHEQNPLDTVAQSRWKDFNAVSAVVLRQTLDHVQQRTLPYSDVLLYPNSPKILYMGGFSDLKFEGEGTLYYVDGKIGYQGGWKGGRMHGQGTLLHEDGSLAWEGVFQDGQPAKPWYSF